MEQVLVLHTTKVNNEIMIEQISHKNFQASLIRSNYYVLWLTKSLKHHKLEILIRISYNKMQDFQPQSTSLAHLSTLVDMEVQIIALISSMMCKSINFTLRAMPITATGKP